MKRAKNEHINGFSVTDETSHFTAYNGNIVICFVAEGRNGGLYFDIKSVENIPQGRIYRGQRYHYKYILPVREIAFYLADNDFLWDYGRSCPLSESRPKMGGA